MLGEKLSRGWQEKKDRVLEEGAEGTQA